MTSSQWPLGVAGTYVTGGGGGQAMIGQARDFLRNNYPHITRLVTLSPPTALARRFHIKNGARELQINRDTVNFEYDLA